MSDHKDDDFIELEALPFKQARLLVNWNDITNNVLWKTWFPQNQSGYIGQRIKVIYSEGGGEYYWLAPMKFVFRISPEHFEWIEEDAEYFSKLLDDSET